MAQKLASTPEPKLVDPPTDDAGTNDDDQQTPTTDSVDDSTEDDDEDEGDPEGSDQLGDPGKKALDTMKAERNAERKKARDLQKKYDELEKERESAGKSPDEKALDDARAEARAEATEKANAKIIRSEVKSAASGKLFAPELALQLLDMTQFEVDDNGDVDAEELSDALDDLLIRYPKLAAQGGTTSFDSARGKPAPKKKLKKSDLSNMTPDQIAKAYDEGRVDL